MASYAGAGPLSFSPASDAPPPFSRSPTTAAPWATNDHDADPPAWSAPTSASSVSSSSILSDSDVPPLYQRVWLVADPVAGTVSLGALQKVISAGGIKASSVEKIISLVAKSSRITRHEFFCALALLAFAQLSKPISIEAVAAARDSLPLPTLPASFERERPTLAPMRSVSEASIDPWSSTTATARVNGGGSHHFVAASSSTPVGYSLHEDDGGDDADDAARDAFGENLVQGGLGYGAEGWALGPQDKVEVVQREALGGWILTHTVWLVRSLKHGSLVERRYSDFVWLHDCLVKRYPFRLVPSLPPKRVAISGHYLAADDFFLERRRTGLARFLTFALNHPTLKHDALLHTFLTLPSELSIWRSQSTFSLEDESTSRLLTPSEEMSIPGDLDTKLTAVRTRILTLVEHWTAITTLVDRLAHRRQNEGADLTRLRVALDAGLETERSGWRTVEVETVEADQEAFAGVLGRVGEVVERSAVKAIEDTVEEVKRHRELYLNYRDLIGRQTTLSADAIDKLKKRVESNMRKLETIREVKKPGYEVELDKVASAIEADQRAIDGLLRRRVFIRWCMWQETLFLFRSTSLLRGAFAGWAAGERDFARLLGDEWARAEQLLGL